MTDSPYEKTIAAIDAFNSDDPNRVDHKGESIAKELLYSRRMTAWLNRLEPDASEALRIAARAQHIGRWNSPRADYPEGRAGYLKWRIDLYGYHAETTGKLMKEAGFDEETIARTETILRKEKLNKNPEAQSMEDVACLVFLENYFDDFTEKYDETKVIDVVRKTWKKMSPKAHEAALTLKLNSAAQTIVEKALSGE